MHLNSIWISEFKNLHDFSLAVDGNRFLDFFVVMGLGTV